MPLSDKTRKILWAKSGNRCAICRHKIVVDQTDIDSESVVGEECHIAAQSKAGPRYDASFPPEKLDDLENLILLCGTHHKMVDDQIETYTVAWLRAKKAEHEKWVETKLSESEEPKPMRVRRSKENLPQKLDLILSGKKLLQLAQQCHSSNIDHEDNLDDSETELVGYFIQDVSEWGEMASELSQVEYIKACKSVGDRIKELADKGFLVFAAVENARIEGGGSPPSNWKIFHLTVNRATNPNIIHPKEEEPPSQTG
jgi:hypothetical protein